MKTNVLSDVQIREMSNNMSLSQCEILLSVLNDKKDRLVKVQDRKSTFIQMVKDWGYGTPTEFLIEGEFILNPNLKRPRTKITTEVRNNIINDVKSGMKTKEISSKYGVTTDSIYNIKGNNGLTKPQKKKVPTPSSPSNVPSVVPRTESEKRLVDEQFDSLFEPQERVA